jgi:hypothetical protein
MAQNPSPELRVSNSSPRAGETQADYRERMAQLQAQALERRQHELTELRSPMNPPGERIRIWERLHQLQLPRSPTHRLISVIAAATGLSLQEVRDEQHLRAAGSTAASS